jgi:hypothetical protein
MESEKLTFRDFPFGLWLGGLGLFAAAGYFFTRGVSSATYTAYLLGFIGLLLLLLPSTLTIIADKTTRTLTLRYGLLIPRSVKTLSFDEIQTIHVDSQTSRTHSKSGGTSRRTTSYRLQVVKKDGTNLPFRIYYSSDFFLKEQRAKKLRAFIGLAETFDETPLGMLSNVPQIAQPILAQQQAALTGNNDQIRETNGVRWQLQTIALGATPITRWYSQDFKTPGTFLYVTQKVQGQKTLYGDGFMASIGKTLFKQVFAMYGFSGNDIPDMEQASVFGPLDPALESNFSAYTDEPNSARQLLTPWVQIPLTQWAQKYPLKQLQSGARFGQISIMFCPTGTYIATLGALQPAQVDELAALGAELIRAQGSSRN